MNSWSMLSEFLTIIVFLSLLIVCSIALGKFRHRRLNLASRHMNLTLMESVSLGGNRLVTLVKVGRSVLVLGVTDHQVTVLKEISESDCEGQVTGQDRPAENSGNGVRAIGETFGSALRQACDRLSRKLGRKLPAILLALWYLFARSYACYAAPADIPLPSVNVNIEGLGGQGGLASALAILGLLTVLALAPAILVLTTSFTRTVVVFSFLRTGLGTQQTPPNQVLIGLALLITFFIMAPTWSKVYDVALKPYLDGEITWQDAVARASGPMKEFMLKQTREKDLALFVELGSGSGVTSPEQLTLLQVVPAFTISELKTAFEMGFLLLLPFMVIDMVVASTLMAMGMLMLPPVLISLPFKLLLFVLVDGWGLITKSIIASFR